MKRTLSFLLSLIMAISIITCVPLAISASVDNLVFDYTFDADSYCVTDCDVSASGELVIPDKYNGLPVTEIADSAFEGCVNLTSVVLPDSITSIGNWAFEGCTDLVSVTIPDIMKNLGCGVFKDCRNIASIDLPDNITCIPSFIFMNCRKLSSIEIPDGVTSIGESAFSGCELLKSVYIYDIANWCNSDYENETSNPLYYADNLYINGELATDVVVPEGVHKIPEYGFSCKSLVTISLPTGVTEIDNKAFYSCINLKSIELKQGIESIGAQAFYGCRELTSIIIPDGAKKLKSGIFMGCEKLASITLPDSIISIENANFDGTAYYKNKDNWEYDGQVLYIGKHLIEVSSLVSGDFCIKRDTRSISHEAFYNCSEITSVKIPDNIIIIPSRAFYKCLNLKSVEIPDKVIEIQNSAFEECKNLVSIKIPDSVQKIGSSAFQYCSSLASINVPKGITAIEAMTFEGCHSLTSIEIPDTVTEIEMFAFSGCEKLSTIIIPDCVTSIGASAFAGCDSLRSIDLPSELKAISNSMFSGCIRLESVVIPEKVTVIYALAFQQCTNLKSITIPKSVVKIGGSIFWYCIGFKNVFYLGTKEEWDAIDIIGDEKLQNADMHYEAAGHTLSDWYVSKEPTVRSIGFKCRECTVCGSTVESVVLPQLKPVKPKISKVSRVHNGVCLEWDYDLGSDYYIVYRKTAKKSWERIAKIPGYPDECTCETDCYCGEIYSVASYVDTKAKTGTTYYYTVKAQNEAGFSDYNKIGLKIKFVAAPKLTKITNEASGVRVYWSKISGADGYYLYRRVAGSKTWTKVATIKKGSTTSYLDKKAYAGKTYEYIIKAYDGSTSSAAAAKVIKIERLTVPKLVSSTSSKTGITIKWGKVAGADGYYVYRKTGSGSWVKVATVKGNAKFSFVDKSAKKGTTYTYTVKAYSGNYTSSYNTKGLKTKDKY